MQYNWDQLLAADYREPPTLPTYSAHIYKLMTHKSMVPVIHRHTRNCRQKSQRELFMLPSGCAGIINPPLQLIFSDEIIERVFVYELLGVLIDNHIDSICSKASSRLHLLTQLKRNGAIVKDMVHFYETVIRSVLEYACTCPAWHPSLTVEQCSRIESIQRWSFKLIYSSTSHYENICQDNSHMSLPDRWEFFCTRFLNSIKNSESCQNYLLPKSRNSATVQGLRNPFYLVPDKPRTTRYKNSFVVYALNNYQ